MHVYIEGERSSLRVAIPWLKYSPLSAVKLGGRTKIVLVLYFNTYREHVNSHFACMYVSYCSYVQEKVAAFDSTEIAWVVK